jgi:hypothetical protein
LQSPAGHQSWATPDKRSGRLSAGDGQAHRRRSPRSDQDFPIGGDPDQRFAADAQTLQAGAPGQGTPTDQVADYHDGYGAITGIPFAQVRLAMLASLGGREWPQILSSELRSLEIRNFFVQLLEKRPRFLQLLAGLQPTRLPGVIRHSRS